MQKIKIANTNIYVSILGLGTVKLGRNTAVKYPHPFTIPNDEAALNIINAAANCGINLLDTAPAYGNSEERIGKLIKKSRQQWIVSTKVGEIFDPITGQSHYDFTPEYISHSVERSLKKLQRDYLDIVLIHSDGRDESIIVNHGALETLNHLKKKGLIRAVGRSTKTVAGGILAAQHSDIVMTTHNLTYREEIDVLDYADKNNKNIFIKKAFASGHNTIASNTADNVTASFDCIYQHKSVSSIILGSITPEHIIENAKKAVDSFSRHQVK
jgi:aryl-alcohol dehydrogenase-like predicted oxidoreductase